MSNTTTEDIVMIAINRRKIQPKKNSNLSNHW